jgi:uncharacterized membrane protein
MIVSYELVVEIVEAVAVALLCLGLTLSTLRFLYGLLRRHAEDVFRKYRLELGRTLQLSLEFLIAADIIETVAVETSLESLGVLGMLVLIRTFLSFALEVEMSGRWPWQTAKTPSAED